MIPGVPSSLCFNHPVVDLEPLNRGLVAWYLTVPGFNYGGYTFRDLKRQFNGTLTNFAQATGSGWAGSTRGTGGFGQLYFDGTDDFVNFGDVFGGFSAMTVTCWAFVTGTPGGGTPYHLFSKFGNNGSFDATDSFALYYDGTFSFILGGPNAVSSSASIGINTLTHIAAVYDGATITVYLNGASSGTPTAASGAINASSGTSTYMGYVVDPASASHYTGWLDDVRVYNRGLNATEVGTLYDLTQRGYPRQLNFVAPFESQYATPSYVPPAPPGTDRLFARPAESSSKTEQPTHRSRTSVAVFDTTAVLPTQQWTPTLRQRDRANPLMPTDLQTPQRVSPSRFSPAADIPDTEPFRIVAPFTIPFEENDLLSPSGGTFRRSKRSRDHEQKVAKLLNSLLRSGELAGTLDNMQLGYVPANPQSWGPTRPTTIAEALDLLIEML